MIGPSYFLASSKTSMSDPRLCPWTGPMYRMPSSSKKRPGKKVFLMSSSTPRAALIRGQPILGRPLRKDLAWSFIFR